MISWRVAPFDVSYYPALNQVVLPSDVLHQPFFDTYFPHAINFGSIGFFLGHEIAHSFVGGGQRFDLHGNYRQWLTNRALELLTKRSECFVQQYSNYAINGQLINGTETLSSIFIISDTKGID